MSKACCFFSLLTWGVQAREAFLFSFRRNQGRVTCWPGFLFSLHADTQLPLAHLFAFCSTMHVAACFFFTLPAAAHETGSSNACMAVHSSLLEPSRLTCSPARFLGHGPAAGPANTPISSLEDMRLQGRTPSPCCTKAVHHQQPSPAAPVFCMWTPQLPCHLPRVASCFLLHPCQTSSTREPCLDYCTPILLIQQPDFLIMKVLFGLAIKATNLEG